jgi:integrase
MARRAKRRANGEGTIARRSDGRYTASAFLLTSDGTYKRKWLYGKTHEEARIKLAAALEQSRRGLPVAAESATVAEYLSYWLDQVVREQRRPKTYEGYESVVRLHLQPIVGKKRLARLSVQDVRSLLTQVRARCLCCASGTDAARPVAKRRCCAVGKCCRHVPSDRQVQFIHAVLRNALQNAMREELITRNVARLVQVRTPTYEINRGLTVEQAKALLAHSRQDRLHALYVLAVYLGLRRAELLGLRWVDVDLKTGQLEVVQTLQRVGGLLQAVPPKTRSSRRSVPLPEPCLVALRQHRMRQHRERLAAGMAWVDSGLVFTTSIGTAVEPGNLRRSWYPLRDQAGIPDVRFHDLRHTCVTLLLDLGVPPHIVREIVGHSAIEVTMTIYAHASLEERRQALSKLAGRLG